MITNVLRTGRALGPFIVQLKTALVKLSSAITKILQKFLSSKAVLITKIILGSIGGILSIYTIFSSVGNIIQYIVDCLDGRWDGYLNTKSELGFHIIFKRS